MVMRPLRQDPTRTTGLRRRFIADVRRRTRALNKAIRQFLVTQDALGLGELQPLLRSIVTNVELRQYAFLTDAGKLNEFNEWLQGQLDTNMLASDTGSAWTAQYVEPAYRQGVTRAYVDANKLDAAIGGSYFDGGKAQFLQQAFAAPEAINKVQLLATRSFENMRGLTQTMKGQMNQILSQGMITGDNPQTIAKQMSKQITKLSETRGLTIARTEVIHAHSEGQLDSFERLGVKELGVMAEWSTAGDDRVCSQCAGMEGVLYTVEEARGIIPLHPNCRCTWIPTEPDNK